MSEALNKRETQKPLLLGDKIDREILTADLNGSPAFELVERAKIDKAIDEPGALERPGSWMNRPRLALGKWWVRRSS